MEKRCSNQILRAIVGFEIDGRTVKPRFALHPSLSIQSNFEFETVRVRICSTKIIDHLLITTKYEPMYSGKKDRKYRDSSEVKPLGR